MFDVIHNCYYHKTPGNVKQEGILDITLSSPLISGWKNSDFGEEGLCWQPRDGGWVPGENSAFGVLVITSPCLHSYLSPFLKRIKDV